MATPIDPDLLAKLQAQGWLDQSQPVGGPPPPAPMAHEIPSGGSFNGGPSREESIRQQLTRPITPMPEQASQGGGAPRAEGVFDTQPSGGEAEKAPAFALPAQKTTPAHSIGLVSPGIRNEYDTAMQQRGAVPAQESTAQDTANQRMASLYEQQSAQLGKQMFAENAARQKRTEALDAQMNDYKRLQDEAANQKEDPGRWWGSKNAGEKVLGVIGIILGGLSQGQGHGNPALDLMNKSVDNDIAAQKANIVQKGKKSEVAYNIYAQKIKQFGDESAADLAARAQMLEQFKLQAQSEALRSQSPILQARAKDLGAQIQLEQAKLHQGLEHWQQGGTAGGITAEDQKRAFELYKSGQAVSMPQAIQAALALRGAAPTQGLPTLVKPGHAGNPAAGDLANSNLLESSKNAPEALGVGERITAGLSHLPGVGPLFQGTEGARKELAIKAANTPVLGFAHKELGARTPEAQEHMAEALLIKPSDSEERIKQKYALRALVARGGMSAAEAAKRVGGAAPSGGGSESSSEKDEE